MQKRERECDRAEPDAPVLVTQWLRGLGHGFDRGVKPARDTEQGAAPFGCDLEEREFLVDIERLLGKHLNRIDEHAFVATQPAPSMTDLAARGRAGGPKKQSSGPSGRRGGGRGDGGGGRRGGRRRRGSRR